MKLGEDTLGRRVLGKEHPGHPRLRDYPNALGGG